MRAAKKQLKKSKKRYKKHYDKKAKPRCLEVGDQVLILLPTDSNKLNAMERTIHCGESCGIQQLQNKDIKMGSKTKTYHVNMLKKYIAREPEVDVVIQETRMMLP